ncbi:hypothetical protein Q8A64_17770 [Oxalobacteraceae bacterium R-40]|uniref:Uncharacterized protein n=1 Tax=Keguizhuia sedimenti TaxID=3064264 RepID=A0ABU1BTC5_9BURK|nr:hypothetical protein [Oxalobacteraceae bacterium R-40]
MRKNVIQLIRITYDSDKKKGVNSVVGTVKLVKPHLSGELQKSLTPEEIEQFEAWLKTRHRADNLRDELAALTLAESMLAAERWFESEGDSDAARQVAAGYVAQWQSLRKVMVKNGLLD